MAACHVVRPDVGKALPLLVIVPHSGTRVPADVRRTLLLGDADLRREIIDVTDHLVDQLFGAAVDKGATMLIQNVSRVVVDVERFTDDEQETMSRFGLGAVYTRTLDGRPLRQDPFPPAERNST